MKKTTIRPYVSIDIETTGVNKEKSHILEIGAVIEDGKSRYEELESLGIMIKEESYEYAEPYAMQMNKGILKEVATAKHDPKIGFQDSEDGTRIMGLYQAFSELVRFIRKASDIAYAWDMDNAVLHPTTRISLAGKNVSAFDLPIIINNLTRLTVNTPNNVKGCQGLVDFFNPDTGSSALKRRVIDPGPMYFEDFGYIPSLGEINTLTSEHEVAHRAVADAMQVIKAVRYKFYEKNK